MDQPSDTRDAVAALRRVVSRVLTVLGGVAAGTAVAWLLSTGSATASTESTQLAGDELTPDRAVTSAAESGVGTERAADEPASEPSDGPVATKLRTVVDELNQRSRDEFARMAERFGPDGRGEMPDVPDLGPAPCVDPTTCDLDGGLDRLPGVDRSETDESGSVTGPRDPAGGDTDGTDSDRTGDTAAGMSGDHGDYGDTGTADAPRNASVGTDLTGTARQAALDQHAAGQLDPRGISERGPPVLPTSHQLPVAPAPSAPLSGSSSHAAGAADAPLFAALPWADHGAGQNDTITLTATQAAPAGRPDAQPGITPD